MKTIVCMSIITIISLLNATPGIAAAAAAELSNAWERPPVLLDDLNGHSHALSEWKGKVILLNFWASWCGPCQQEIPALIQYQQQYGALGLQVIGIGIDDPRPLRNVSRTFRINYPVLVASGEQGNRLLSQWDNPQQMVPYSVLIGRNGDLLLNYRGTIDNSIIQDYVLPALHPKPAMEQAK